MSAHLIYIYIVMESNSTKYAFDTNSEALFKVADKLLDVVGPSVLDGSVLDDSDQASLIPVRPLYPW